MAPVRPGLHFLETLKAFLCHFNSSELPVTTLRFIRSEIVVCVLCFLIIQSASVKFGVVSFAIVSSLPGSVVQQWEETENNVQHFFFFFYQWKKVERENVCWRGSEKFTNCWFVKNFTHYHLFLGINGDPKSHFVIPALWEKMACRRREPEENANWWRWSLITCISDLNKAIYLSAFMLFVRHHLPCFKCSTLSSEQTVSSRFWLMTVSLRKKLQKMLIILNSFWFFLEIQFSFLL